MRFDAMLATRNRWQLVSKGPRESTWLLRVKPASEADEGSTEDSADASVRGGQVTSPTQPVKGIRPIPGLPNHAYRNSESWQWPHGEPKGSDVGETEPKPKPCKIHGEPFVGDFYGRFYGRDSDAKLWVVSCKCRGASAPTLMHAIEAWNAGEQNGERSKTVPPTTVPGQKS